VRILPFPCLRRNELASKANSGGDREFLLAHSWETGSSGCGLESLLCLWKL
jgi:hypothetical protein